MVTSKDLQQLGFSKNTAQVYLALVKLGQAKAAALITATGLHRNLVYTALQTLVHKKLITTTSLRGVAQFKILNPERLLNEITQKEKLAHHLVEELRAQQPFSSQEIVVYEGVDEVQRKELESYQRMRAGETMYYLGGSPRWYQVMGVALIKKCARIQRKTNFFLKIILSAKTPEVDIFFEILPDAQLFQMKFIPHITSEMSETQILPDRVMIKTLVEPYSVIEIINPAIAKSYRDYFDLMWDSETPSAASFQNKHRNKK